MRTLAAWTTPFLLVVLAGCSGGDGQGATGPPTGPGIAAQDLAANVTQEQLSFAASEQEQGITQEVTISPTEACLFFFGPVACTEEVVDLTPLIPPDTPVQLDIQVEHNAQAGAFVGWDLRMESAAITDYDDDEEQGQGGGQQGQDEQDVVVIVMQPGGRVELVVQQFFTGAPPQDTQVTVTARSVVRPTVVPAFLPVALDLAVGDTLLAAGDGLEDFVVVPPGGIAQHHLGPFAFNATTAGRHIVVASGQGDIKLFGPPETPMKALLVQEHVGEPRAVSGTEVSWQFTVEGVPLSVGIEVSSADNAGEFGAGQFHGNFQVVVERGGAEVLEVSETDCAIFVQCGLTPFSDRFYRAYGDTLDERIGPGTYDVRATFETSNNMQVRELYTYVLP